MAACESAWPISQSTDMSDTSYGRLSRQFVSLLTAERVLLICVVLGSFLAILRSSPVMASPYQIDYGEGLMLEGALCIRHAQPLYPDPFGFPVVLHEYGPVAYAATAAVLSHGAPSFPAGRFLILLCSVTVSFLLAASLRHLTSSWWIGLSFGFLLLTLPAFRFWLCLLRADVVGVVFSVAGIALYLLHEKWLVWSIPFFGLALFCKYTLVAAPIAVFVHLVLNRKTSRGLLFAAGLAGACVLAFVAVQAETGGWFATHMFSIHPDRYSLAHFVALAAVVWASAPIVTALAVWYAGLDFRAGERGFPAIYLAVASVTSLTAGKLGANTNHFIEWMVACCMCAGMGYSLLLSKHAARFIPVTVLLSVSVLAGVVAQNRLQQLPSGDMAECGMAYRYVNDAASTRVLSESTGPLLLAGKPVFVSDPFVYGQFVKQGLWPDRRVEELLVERYFGLIVMSRDASQLVAPEMWPNSLVRAIQGNYRTVRRFRCRGAGVMLEPVSPDRGH
jgi:hypothetical protein